MKILLVGFKLSIGNELYMSTLYKHLTHYGHSVNICGDKNYIYKYNIGYLIANGGNSKQMIIDTINPLNWIKYYKLLSNNDYDKVFFISSHTLNNIAILISKFFKNTQTISHIHDPIPHSGTSYAWIILLSQKIQARISDKIVVYGDGLKDIIINEYKINKNKISVIKHGVYRDNRDNIEVPKQKKYISLLGRIDEYKGIDTFLEAIELIDNKIDKNIKFVIGGKGDLDSYTDMIKKLEHRLIIKNYLIPNDEFDDILLNSYCLVLPYKDGTQTGNIQVAYYNAIPVIVSKVGSFPELVVKNQTGYLTIADNKNDLAEKILELLDSDYYSMGLESFAYYKQHLKWDTIIQNLINIFERKVQNDNKK